MNTLKASKTEGDNQSVFNIAEAGLNNAVNELDKEIQDISKNYNNENDFFKALNNKLKDIENKENKPKFEKVNNTEPKTIIKLTKVNKAEKTYKDYGVDSFGDMQLDPGNYNKDIGTANDKKTV